MKILVVEDEHRIANAVKTGLNQEKYTVDVAYEGQTGFDLALTEDYTVIILDLMLPKMDGLSVCRQLRKNNVHTPILILTAKGQLQDKVNGLNSGADDYLVKPFSFEELLARIKALSRRPKPIQNDLLAVADLEMNTSLFIVKRNSTLINLSSKEYSILEYLMRHHGQILSKDQIVSHVWDYESDILPNTVEAFIKNIRKKIDLPFTNLPKLIHTVRGFGYSLKE
jgi:DNA-binding response OmpR family regulator